MLQLTCFKDCIQHYPKSYQDALYKANVKKEFYPLKTAIEARYNIPKEYQRVF